MAGNKDTFTMDMGSALGTVGGGVHAWWGWLAV